VLCLNCKNRMDKVPPSVEVEISGKTVDVAEELKGMMERASKIYPITLYCDVKKGVVVGNPATKAQQVVECNSFTPT